MHEFGWFLTGSLWLLGGAAILMCEGTYGTRYPLVGSLWLIALWPFVILLGMMISMLELVTSRRVR